MIETATQALSIALFDAARGAAPLAAHHALVGRGHAEAILPAIAAMPDGGRADHIAVDIGPGSFTGIRIGIAAARALAFAWGASLSGFSALAMIAAAARRDFPGTEPLMVAITGGHGELFWQMFDPGDLAERTAPASTPIALLAADHAGGPVYGTGAEALTVAGGKGTAIPMHPDARDFLLLPASAMTDMVRPLYGRGADARPMTRTAAVP